MIGKAELAKALGWSRPRLDRRLETDRLFPVANRTPWQFDLDKVRAYLDPPAPPAIDLKQLADVVKPPAPAATHRGEATAKQRKESAQADLYEHKLQQIKEEVVSRTEVTAIIAEFLTILGKSFDGLPDVIARVLGMPESAIPIIRELHDDARLNAAGNLRKFLSG